MSKLDRFQIPVSDKMISIYKVANKVWIHESLVCELFKLHSFSDFKDMLKYAGCFIVQEVVCKKFNLGEETSYFVDLKTLDFAIKAFDISDEGRVILEAINDWLLENESDFFLTNHSFCVSEFKPFESAIIISDKLEREEHLYDQPFNLKLFNINEFFIFRVIDKLQSDLGLKIPRIKKDDNSTSRKILSDYCKLVVDSFNDTDKFLGRMASFEERIANLFFMLLKSNYFDYCDNSIDIAVVLAIMDIFYSRPPFNSHVDELISNDQLMVAAEIVNCSCAKTLKLIERISHCFKPSGLTLSVSSMTEKSLQLNVMDKNRANVIKAIVAYIESFSTVYHHSDYYTISYQKSHMGASCNRFRLNIGASLEKQDTLVFDYILSPFIENELRGCLDEMKDVILNLVSRWLKKDLSCLIRNNVGFYNSLNDLKLDFRPHLIIRDYME